MKGFTLIEVLVALVLIGVVLLPLGKFYSVLSADMAARQQRTTALHTLENQETLLRRTPFDQLREGPYTLDVADLPEGKEDLQIASLPEISAKQVTIALHWHTANGEKRLDHTLILSPFGLR